ISASQRVLLALVGKGWRREDAYKQIQTHAMKAWLEGLSFRQLVEEDAKIMRDLTTAELDKCFDPAYYVRHGKELLKRAGLPSGDASMPDLRLPVSEGGDGHRQALA